MRLFLKFILTILSALFLGIIFLTIGEVEPDSLLNLLTDFSSYRSIFPTIFFLLWMGRIFILIAECFLLRAYLTRATNEFKQLLFVNVETFVTLSVLFFLMLPLLKINWLPQYLIWMGVIVLAGCIGLGEVYIKLDFIKTRHLSTNLTKVTKILSYIIIPTYMISMAIILFLVHRNN